MEKKTQYMLNNVVGGPKKLDLVILNNNTQTIVSLDRQFDSSINLETTNDEK